jgi:hypothetical protein
MVVPICQTHEYRYRAGRLLIWINVPMAILLSGAASCSMGRGLFPKLGHPLSGGLFLSKKVCGFRVTLARYLEICKRRWKTGLFQSAGLTRYDALS